MTIFSTPRLQREDMGAHEFSTGLGDVIGAAASEAAHEMPTHQLGDMLELAGARGDFDKAPFSDPFGAGLDPVGVEATRQRQPETIARIPLTEAKAKVKEAGLDKALTLSDGEDIASPALDIMMERARGRQERAATIARGPSGVIPTALSVGTSFAVGALDPVNIAAAFIPVVGEARYAKMLADASLTLPATMGERLAARAGIGAASGAVGMAAIEPIAAYAKTQEGQDYTFAHALRSVIFGAFLGSALHTGGGAIADVLRARAGRPLYPFDVGEPLEFHTPWDELKLPPAGSTARPAEGEPPGRPPVSETASGRAGLPPEGDLRTAEPPPPPAGTEPVLPSPAVALIDDLPPRAREDAMRGAVAALVQGEPVRVGEMIEAGAMADPRIAESVDAGKVQAVAGAAEFTPAGRAVFQDMREQLVRQGLGPDIADANAAVFAARYEARAARLEGAGGTAEDLYRAEGIQVRRGGVEDELGGRTYAQPREELPGQLDLGGTGPISDAELAQRRADQALKPKVAQRPMDEGLFGDTSQQADLVDQARRAPGKAQRELFQGGERGRITLADNRAIIDLFKSADRSTLMHEAGHLWLDELARDAARVNAPAGIRDDMASVLRWLGAERPEAITTEQHEKWARGFEQYLASGEAPTPALKSAFEKFKDWLTAIYKSITAIGEPIPAEIRSVFDRMLAMPAHAAEKAEGGNVVAGPKPRRGPAARDPETFSLLEFIASRGGLRNDDPLIGDVVGSIGRGNKAIPGFGSLIRQPVELSTAARMGGRHAPMTLDRAREAAVEAGYLHDNGAIAGGEAETTINTLLEAIDRELRGQKVYRRGREPEKAIDADQERHYAEQHQQAVNEVREHLAGEGLSHETMPDARLARVLQIMRQEGESDPLNAFERAVMEESHDAAEAGEHERVADHIPGWDVPDVAGAASAPGRAVAGGRETGPGGGARGPGGGDRAAIERDTWQRLADTQRDFNEPEVVAASKRAGELPEPESAQPGKRLQAAQKAEAEAQAAYESQAAYLPADLRGEVEHRLRVLEQDTLDTAEVVRLGAACLAGGIVEAVA